jgi:nucleoside-diphosphate-sugar epimerase
LPERPIDPDNDRAMKLTLGPLNPPASHMAPASTPDLALVTGGTGLLGSHLAERLVAGGHRVRALVRPGSDTAFLRGLGVELLTGDLTDPVSCTRAAEGVHTVYHAAAKVGDWGTWAEFQADCLDATERIARAAHASGARRFVHVSSTSAYGHPLDGGPIVDETHPLGQGLWRVWDGYTRSKVEQERLLWRLHDEIGLPLTVVRPSWLFGERDRTTTRRLAAKLVAGKVVLLGPGDNPLSAIHAGEVAAAAILAGGLPIALGRAYNVTDQGPITQKQWFEMWSRELGVPAPTRHVPYRVAFAAGFAMEAAGRLSRSRKPPLITRYAAWLLGRRVRYGTDRARDELGWRPSTTYQEAISRTVAWLRSG